MSSTKKTKRFKAVSVITTKGDGQETPDIVQVIGSADKIKDAVMMAKESKMAGPKAIFDLKEKLWYHMKRGGNEIITGYVDAGTLGDRNDGINDNAIIINPTGKRVTRPGK